jgi:hypothetical protein
MPGPFGIALAALCAGLMGFAIQRGATCAVVAVHEVIERRSARRLAAMAEASLWVTGGLLLAGVLQAMPRMPEGFPLTGWTLLGGVLLGLGAAVNGACVFGAIGRLGRGEWAYLATPLGFWLGCVVFPRLLALPAPEPLPQTSLVLGAPAWVALVFAGFAAWRILRPAFARRAGAGSALRAWVRELSGRAWAPHAATCVIGVTFVILLLLAGPWGYTELLAELAKGMAESLPLRAFLALCLLGGAVLGGWTSGGFRNAVPAPAQLARCLGGGALMAWGGKLVPGSNDGLILLGMPLLWPYAWAAFLTMCAAIALLRLARMRRGMRMAAGAQRR